MTIYEKLYDIAILSAIVGVILLFCWFVIWYVIRREMKKSMPVQLSGLWSIIGNKPIRVVMDIDKNGRAEIVDFRANDGGRYIG